MNQDNQGQKPMRQPLIIPKRPIVREPPMYQHASENRVLNSASRSNESAANIVRSNIDAIYRNDPEASMTPEPTEEAPVAPNPTITQPAPDPPLEKTDLKPLSMQTPVSPVTPKSTNQTIDSYEKSHSEEGLKADEEKWREYHSAWQNYYQQYFYRHYAGYIHQKDTELENERHKHTESNSETSTSISPGSIAQNEALNSLRSELRDKIRSSTQKARKSRHFIPITAAASVMIIFAFLQYNTQVVGFFASFVSPGNVIPENIIVDESIDVPVGPEPKLIIPKINVNEPIVWDTANDEKSQLEAMKNGIAYFGIPGASSKPGQIGNTVLSAHSTNNLLETGDHKFVFLHLPEMRKGDTVYINNNETRYTYKVTSTEVVKPNEVSKLVYETDVPVITLITCVPIGTAENRLLVTAEQVSPNVEKAIPAPTSQKRQEPAKLTGNSPSFIERLFGSR